MQDSRIFVLICCSSNILNLLKFTRRFYLSHICVTKKDSFKIYRQKICCERIFRKIFSVRLRSIWKFKKFLTKITLKSIRNFKNIFVAKKLHLMCFSSKAIQVNSSSLESRSVIGNLRSNKRQICNIKVKINVASSCDGGVEEIAAGKSYDGNCLLRGDVKSHTLPSPPTPLWLSLILFVTFRFTDNDEAL